VNKDKRYGSTLLYRNSLLLYIGHDNSSLSPYFLDIMIHGNVFDRSEIWCNEGESIRHWFDSVRESQILAYR